jgi:hypothetical protein
MKLRNAASKGESELRSFYSFQSYEELPITVSCVKRLFHQAGDPCKTHRYSYQVPDYAQYVYNHCSHLNLNPGWSEVCLNPPCGRGGRQTYTGDFDRGGDCTVFLHISW